MRMVGLAGLYRQCDRAMGPDRRRRPQGARGAGAAGRHGPVPDALPFMGWATGEIAGIPARVYRISFSGELSFEVAVPANRGLELWEKLHQAGADLGITPYGTEAMHVMRAEKGFIMIGDETDGTVIPQDLGLAGRFQEKDRLYRQARPGTQPYDRSRPLEAGGP